MNGVCKHCHSPFYKRGNLPYLFCSRKCYTLWTRRENKPNWKGGYHRSDGYKILTVPDGRRMREHRYIMEQALGRLLKKDEIVHHLDGNPRNNTPENLSIIDRGKHVVIHATYRGPKRKQCSCCRQTKSRSEFTTKHPKKPTHDTHDSHCKDCNARNAREKRKTNLPIHD